MSRLLLAASTAPFLVGLGLSSPAAAATTTYHGTFEYRTSECQPTVPADGQWNITLRDSHDAVVTVDIFRDGSHLTSFGDEHWSVVNAADPLVLTHPFGDGIAVTITLQQSTLTYTITGLDPCAHTYHGTLTG